MIGVLRYSYYTLFSGVTYPDRLAVACRMEVHRARVHILISMAATKCSLQTSETFPSSHHDVTAPVAGPPP